VDKGATSSHPLLTSTPHPALQALQQDRIRVEERQQQEEALRAQQEAAEQLRRKEEEEAAQKLQRLQDLRQRLAASLPVRRAWGRCLHPPRGLGTCWIGVACLCPLGLRVRVSLQAVAAIMWCAWSSCAQTLLSLILDQAIMDAVGCAASRSPAPHRDVVPCPEKCGVAISSACHPFPPGPPSTSSRQQWMGCLHTCTPAR
jgi:hypothetical protein